MTDSVAFPFMRLDVYRSARELAVRVEALGIRRASLRDQAVRACESVVLALAEGLFACPSSHRRDSARSLPSVELRATRLASLCEVAGALDLAVAVGATEAAATGEALTLAGRVRAMTVALLR